MRRNYVYAALGIWVLAFLVSACTWYGVQAGSPALQPFLAGAPEPEAVTLQETLAVGLVWLSPSEGSETVPERAERAALEVLRSHFAERGKTLQIVRVDRVTSLDLSSLRGLGQTHGLAHLLLVAPSVREIEVPAWLGYGRAGYSLGTRTETYVLLEAVGIALESGSSLFAGRGNGAAMLEELDYGPLGPWYPRISRGIDLGGYGGFIFPDAEEFLPDEVRAVALKDALAVLLVELDRLRPQNNS